VIIGTDHAHYDWMRDGVYCPVDYSASKSKFVFLKAFNREWLSPHFLKEYEAARKAGLYAGAYVWPHPADVISGDRQVNAWWEVLGALDCPVAIDFEYLDGLTRQMNCTDLYGVVARWVDKTDRVPIIYTRASYWNDFGGRDKDDPYWGDFPLWVAHYRVPVPTLPGPWNEWTFWQWNDRGLPADYGVVNGKMEVDENLFNGDEGQLSEFFNQSSTPPTGEPMSYRYSLTPKPGATKVNVRADHNVSSADIGDLFAGQTAQGNELYVFGGEKWLKCEVINTVNRVGWIAVIHNGADVCILTDYGAPPPSEKSATVTITTDDGYTGTAVIPLTK
jgi:GH25 family lysozyme M1 (1,4-beta-N-acetylmuramidase)